MIAPMVPCVADKISVPIIAQFQPARDKSLLALSARPLHIIAMERTDSPSLDALMLRIRDHRDRTAFAALFEQMAPRLKAYLMGKEGGAQMVEDVLQNVMLKIWHRAVTFNPEKASATTWIFTIARNARVDMLRKTIKPVLDPEEPDLQPNPEPGAEDIVDLAQASEQLCHAITTLPDEQREILNLAYFSDLSHGEIAAKTGLALGTVKSRLRLALGKLRKELR